MFCHQHFPSACGQSPSACIFVQKCTAKQQKDNVQHKPMQVVRIMSVKDGEVAILDFHLRSDDKLIEVSLWRDEALVDLKMGDHIEMTHLKASVWTSGRSKLNSTSHTRVKVNNI
ncbi:hypothetical protein G5714_004582 [Onychostoma macrolepis]|uniref:Uncharacterized protein n=1 Tax=Onychostoma macrolepis TaxID=369639 RepID=A0A7J6D522_9TELE|nr:hypothetical protein G5714_004582 [Onychostoma macrolepis]